MHWVESGLVRRQNMLRTRRTLPGGVLAEPRQTIPQMCAEPSAGLRDVARL